MYTFMNFEVTFLCESFLTSWEIANKLAWNIKVSSLKMDKKSLLALIVSIAIWTLGYLNMVLFNLFLESLILSLNF